MVSAVASWPRGGGSKPGFRRKLISSCLNQKSSPRSLMAKTNFLAHLNQDNDWQRQVGRMNFLYLWPLTWDQFLEMGGGGQFVSLFPRLSLDPALPNMAPSPNIIMGGECSGSKQHPVKNQSCRLIWCKVESISCRPDQNATGDCFNSTSLYFSK